MSFKNRIGTFFILIGAILLFVFATSVFTPDRNYEVTALLAGALLFVLGWQWRLSKAKGAPPAPAAKPPGQPAATSPKPAAAAPRKRGPLALIRKGPPNKKTAPPPPPAAAPAGLPKKAKGKKK